MSLFIRHCLSQDNTRITKKPVGFKPFCRERNHMGRILKRNFVRKVITSEQILQTLKVPSDQYFRMRKIEQSERRFQNWQRERSRGNEDEISKLNLCYQDLQRLIKNLKFYQQKPRDSFHQQIRQTDQNISLAKSTILENRKRLKNPIFHNLQVSSQAQQDVRLSAKKSSIQRSNTFDSFIKMPSFKKNKHPYKCQTFETEEVPVYRGHTLQHKKLKRSLYNIIPQCL